MPVISDAQILLPDVFAQLTVPSFEYPRSTPRRRCGWSDEYGRWQTVYGLFRRWQRAGVWAGILTALRARADAAGLITWEVSVDSTVCRAHQHAAGARRDGEEQKEPPGGVSAEPDDHALGRSRGGLTSKLHLAVEQGQKPMSLVVTAGQRGQQSAVHRGARRDSGATAGSWPASDPAATGAGGQGLLVPQL